LTSRCELPADGEQFDKAVDKCAETTRTLLLLLARQASLVAPFVGDPVWTLQRDRTKSFPTQTVTAPGIDLQRKV